MDRYPVSKIGTGTQRSNLVDGRAAHVSHWLHQSIELTRAAHQFRSQLKRHTERYGLGDRPFLVLWMLSSTSDESRTDCNAQELNQVTLATALGMSPAQLSAVLEQLRRRQLVESRRSTADRRRQHWQLTPAGSSLRRAILNDLTGVVSDLRHKEAA